MQNQNTTKFYGEKLMEIVIHDKFSFNKLFLRDIINKNKKNGKQTMFNIASKQSLILYSVVNESDYMLLVKKENPKEHLVFTEYRIQRPQKGKVLIQAEIDISNMLDMLNPETLHQIRTYERQCINRNMSFSSDKELMSIYMKTRHLNLIRYCQNQSGTITNTNYIVYKVHNIGCIKRVEICN